MTVKNLIEELLKYPPGMKVNCPVEQAAEFHVSINRGFVEL